MADENTETAIIPAVVIPPADEAPSLPKTLSILPPPQLAQYVAAVAAEIAARNIVVGPPDRPWAEHESLSEWAAGRLGVSPETAIDLVSFTGAELWEGRSPDTRHVRRSAMLSRLAQYKQMLLTAAGHDWVETTYHFVDEIDKKTGMPSGRMIKKPFKEKRVPRDITDVIREIQEIERFEAELGGLLETTAVGASSAAELLAEVEEETREGEGGSKVTRRKKSIAHQVKTSTTMTGPAQAAARRVLDAAKSASVGQDKPQHDD